MSDNIVNLVELGGEPPAGWVYVASHPAAQGDFTKIGYSKWHPILPCLRYREGFKRLHHLEFSLRAFGLGELKKWSSEYHPDARGIEKRIRNHLKGSRRHDVGKSREIFEVPHSELVSIVRTFIAGQGTGDEN